MLLQRRALSSFRQRIPGCGWRSIGASGDALTIRVRDSEQKRASDEHIPPTVLTWIRLSAKNAVLPSGYPDSVRSTYPAYVRYTALGLFTGRVQSVLATQAMLFTVGLGQGAIPMAAAIQWVLKDGLGNAGAIAYAAAVNTKFDADAKRYRFQSTVALTASDFVAIVMPLVPQHFLLMASLSSAIGSIAGLAQTASRARVMSAFALRGNLADLTRAGQTQGKLMSIVGTSAGAGLSWVIGPDPVLVGTCMVPLAVLSLWCMHVSSRLVVLRSLNVQRAERVFHALLRALPHGWHAAEAAAGEAAQLSAPSPETIADVETFAREYRSLFATELLLQPLIGGPLTGGWRLALPWAQHVDARAVESLLQPAAGAARADGGWTTAWHAGGTYAIATRAAPSSGGARSQVVVWHSSKGVARDKVQAVWHACVIRHALEHAAPSATGEPLALAAVDAAALRLWPAVHDALVAAEWALETVHLDGEGAFIEREGDEPTVRKRV
jgi:hypothetical protein